jgi:hypothetical protein
LDAKDWIGPILGLAGLIGAGLIGHAISDAQKQGRMEADIKNLKEQIGTSETGLIGSLHKQKNTVGRLQALMYFIADKLGISVKRDDE